MVSYIGLDLHMRYVHGCRLVPGAPDGQQERHFRFPNTLQDWWRFAQSLDQDCQVALEATGSAFEIFDLLCSSRAGKILVANPTELRRLGSGRHTDQVDARRLARMLAVGTLPEVWVPPQEIRHVRRLLRYRERLVCMRTRLINQGKAVLHRHGHFLRDGADLLRGLSREELAALPEVDQAILGSVIRQITILQEEIDEIEAWIARLVAGEPGVQLLLTITGIGLVSAATIWAYVGDPRRFRNPKQVTRYAGLDPSIHQSGEQHRQGRISKNGSPLLRRTLVEAANVLSMHDTGPLGEFYRRKAKRIGHNKAIIALARKLLIVAWRMLLTGEVYRAVNPRALARKQKDLHRKALQPPRSVETVLANLTTHQPTKKKRGRKCEQS